MKRKRDFISVLLLLLLLVAQVAYAMSSANYRIDWNNLLTGSGGSASSDQLCCQCHRWSDGF